MVFYQSSHVTEWVRKSYSMPEKKSGEIISYFDSKACLKFVEVGTGGK